MGRIADDTIAAGAAAQVRLLNAGKPLEAFDAFFDEGVLMYANGALFASGASEGRAKQEPYIATATSIAGRITDLAVVEELGVCVFRNRSTFVDADGATHAIDGLAWQRWAGGRVVEERYFDGAPMSELLAQGILSNPAMLLDV